MSNQLNSEYLSEVLFEHLGLVTEAKFVLALSGGLDSCVLLELLCQLRDLNKHQGFKVEALHFNHGIQKSSDQWAGFCRDVCSARQVPITVSSFEAEHIAINKNLGLEASARSARYEWFAAQLKNEPNAVLLTAHHANDQAETVIFNLIRGTGVAGLRGIANISQKQLNRREPYILVRPLLTVNKIELERYANQQQLKWIDDPSNLDTHFSRNKIRHTVIPALTDVKEDAVAQIVKASEHLIEAHEILTHVAKCDLQHIQQIVYCPLDKSYGVSLADLQQLLADHGKPRLKNLLSYWLRSVGVKHQSQRLFVELCDWVNNGVNSGACLESGEHQIRAYRDNVFVMPKIQPIDTSLLSRVWKKTDKAFIIKELNVRITHEGVPEKDIKIMFSANLTSSKLKKKFQSAGVPVWRRSITPIVQQGNELLCLNYNRTNHGFLLSGIDA